MTKVTLDIFRLEKKKSVSFRYVVELDNKRYSYAKFISPKRENLTIWQSRTIKIYPMRSKISRTELIKLYLY